MTLQENYKIKQAYVKMLCEAEGEVDHRLHDLDHPAVWIGTYGNYNEGNLYGHGKASGWIDLTTFSDGDEFRSWLNEQSGGRDVEWMFQDFQGFPDEFYGESYIDDRLWDWMKFMDTLDEHGLTKEQFDKIVDGLSDYDRARKAVENDGFRIWRDCRSFGQVARDMISELGIGAFKASDYVDAFDYEKFGKECTWDWSENEHDGMSMYEAYGVSEDDNEALGRAIIEDYGDFEEMIEEVINPSPYRTLGRHGVDDEWVKGLLNSYVDDERLGNDLRHYGTWIECGDDMIEIYDS